MLIFLTFILLGIQVPANNTHTTVPFEIIGSKHMAVQIKINGKGPYRVIFDTGAPISLLTNKVAMESGLIQKNKTTANAFMGMNGMTKIPELQVGDVLAKDIQVIVMDHPTVKAIGEIVGPVEGIIGFPFFAKFHTSINYQTKTLTMVPTSYDPGDVMAGLMTTMMSNNKNKKLYLSPMTTWGLSVGKEASDEEDGIEIIHVFPKGLAESAGLKVGDRLLTLDGTWTESLDDCYRAVSQVKPGRKINVTVRREGQTKTIEVNTKAGL
ncbi:MAG: PDZ domain-containing protein [Gemmatales bacterium]